ncbi:MAG: AAA family ATPase [Planctomycetes bacterium]|nr:AAA family ATPase [Planctomycetota bacterium]
MPSDPLRTKFTAVRAALCSSLVERDDEIDLCLTALVAREHVLFVGPPGLAKSALLDGLLACATGTKFSILMTKYTQPEEIFGPVSLSALKADRYVRVTTGRVPEAEFLFADELFKASSAILNTLLRILNERTFDAGDGTARRVPLRLCVAAGNEWPDPESGKELAAAFDRFLLRKAVQPVRSATGRSRLLWETRPLPRVEHPLASADLDAASAASTALPWTKEARESLETILKELAKEGVRPGDRRQFKTVNVVRAFAWLGGADAVRPEHLEVAQHSLWDSPEGQPQKVAQVIARVANPSGMRVTQLLLEVENVVADTDTRNLADAAKAAAKLGEVERQLGSMSGSGRVEKARAYVKDQLKKLKLASIEAM